MKLRISIQMERLKTKEFKLKTKKKDTIYYSNWFQSCNFLLPYNLRSFLKSTIKFKCHWKVSLVSKPNEILASVRQDLPFTVQILQLSSPWGLEIMFFYCVTSFVESWNWRQVQKFKKITDTRFFIGRYSICPFLSFIGNWGWVNGCKL